MDGAQPLVIERPALDRLITVLRDRGFAVMGPTVRSGAVVIDELRSGADLPAGWTDAQEAGTYRLTPSGHDAVFAHNAGPQSFKQVLFPPALTVWRGRRRDDGRVEADPPEDPPPLALLGVRSCDLHAIAIQDRVFLHDRFEEPDYATRRRGAFLVAVNCATAGGTCFCVSMGTGPRATAGYDLALTELTTGGPHRFLLEIGSARGAEVAAELAPRPAPQADEALAAEVVARTAAAMGRELDTDGIKDLLYANAEHPRWDDAAERCLTCGNCTMVCPTCFCSTVEEVTDLAGADARRTREWDSCFTLGHSHLQGGSVRASGRARYRQWMTHKLGSWIDQFGTSGCVGCGRCITWCPTAIDITEEAAAIRATDLRDLAAEGPADAHHR
ncbi:MAG TPA: 4Fe-4S dicluster domain-containing protein [Baekduia sp.]|nr:4Fe-4S dicluster domain-containing protein [Baekduia sp.]